MPVKHARLHGARTTGPVPCTSEIFVVLSNGCVAREGHMVLEVEKIWPQVRHGA